MNVLDAPELHAHLKTVKMVSFMFCVFSHNKVTK